MHVQINRPHKVYKFMNYIHTDTQTHVLREHQAKCCKFSHSYHTYMRTHSIRILRVHAAAKALCASTSHRMDIGRFWNAKGIRIISSCVRARICMYACMCVCVNIYIYIYIYTAIYIYIYIYCQSQNNWRPLLAFNGFYSLLLENRWKSW
jgi:hypothetical protein